MVDIFLYDFIEGFSHGDDVGEADVPEAEDFVLHRFSHVAVDEEDFFAVLAHGNGYVGNGGDLPSRGVAEVKLMYFSSLPAPAN